MNFHRCSICNKTDNPEVETNIGDLTKMPFVPDPNNSSFDVCMECYEAIRETLYEFDDMDGVVVAVVDRTGARC